MTALLVLLPGMLVVGGVFAVVLAFRPQYARLDDALAALGEPHPAEEVSSVSSNERIGAWWLKRRPAAVTAAQRRALELRGRSPERHYTVKLIAAGAGIALPLLVAAALDGEDLETADGSSPALERYRQARAEREELELAKRRDQLLEIGPLQEALAALSALAAGIASLPPAMAFGVVVFVGVVGVIAVRHIMGY